MKKVLKFAGWRVELDSLQIFPNDPGAGCPALVVSPDGLTGTYWCVVDTGEIDCGTEEVPPTVQRWLSRIEDEVNEFVEIHSGNGEPDLASERCDYEA